MIIKVLKRRLQNHVYDLRDISSVGFDDVIFKEKLCSFLLDYNVKVSLTDKNIKSYKEPRNVTMIELLGVTFSDAFSGEESIYFMFENKDDAVMFKLKFL